MRVNVDPEAVLFALAQEGDDVVKVFRVVFSPRFASQRQLLSLRGNERSAGSRSGVFDRFPGRDEAQAGEPPPL